MLNIYFFVILTCCPFLSTREDPRVNAENENIVKTYSQTMELAQCQNMAFITTFTTIKLVQNVICDWL
jgi:hypothetical protein